MPRSGDRSDPIQGLTGKIMDCILHQTSEFCKKAKTSEVGNSFTHMLECKLMGLVAACFPEEFNQMWMFQISCCRRDRPPPRALTARLGVETHRGGANAVDPDAY